MDEAHGNERSINHDVFVIDADAPGLLEAEMNARIRAAAAAGHVIVIANDARPEKVERALNAGACGYIGKSSPAFTLLHSLVAATPELRFHAA